MEGKPRGLLKKFYLVGALGLSDATERRYGVVGPRRGLLGDELRVEENERRERIRERKEKRRREF